MGRWGGRSSGRGIAKASASGICVFALLTCTFSWHRAPRARPKEHPLCSSANKVLELRDGAWLSGPETRRRSAGNESSTRRSRGARARLREQWWRAPGRNAILAATRNSQSKKAAVSTGFQMDDQALAFTRNTFVETEAFRKLLELVRSHRSPILLIAPGGSGKTINLRALMQTTTQEKRTALMIAVPEIRGDTDLINAILDQLADQEVAPASSVSISSSADLASGSVAALLNALPNPPVVIFDDIAEGETAENTALRIAIGEIHRNTRAALVLSGRSIPPWLSSEIGRFYEITLGSFSSAEIQEFLAKRGISGPAQERASEIRQFTGGHALSVALVAELIREGRFGIDDIIDLSEMPSVSLIDSIIRREMSQLPARTGEMLRDEDYPSVLARLAVQERLPAAELPIDEKTLNPILMSSILLVRDGPYIALRHQSFSAPLQQILGLAPPSGFRISDLSFGMEEAERDALLDEQFQSPRGMEKIIAGETTIVVGDRGSGKSALYSELVRMHGDPDASTIIVAIRDPRAWIEKLETDGRKLETAEEFRAAWCLCVAIAIAEREDVCGEYHQSAIAAGLREAFSGPSPRPARKWYEHLLPILGRTRVKFSLGPFAFEADPRASKSGASKTLEVDAFLRDVDRGLTSCGKKLTLAVDRVDEIYKYDRSRQERLVQGLFQAEGEMSRFKALALLIFIRSDLFYVYSIQEKNKIVSRKLDLTWSEKQLRDLMLARVYSDLRLLRLKERTLPPRGTVELGTRAAFPRTVEEVPFLDWLWSSMRNGNGNIAPRQIVLFLILATEAPEAQSQEVAHLPLFSSAVLRFAMNRLSEISFEEMVDDFRVAPNFLRNCRAGKLHELGLEDVDSLFAKDDGDKNLSVDHLERLGFLERIVKQEPDGTKRTHFRIPAIYTRAWAAGAGHSDE